MCDSPFTVNSSSINEAPTRDNGSENGTEDTNNTEVRDSILYIVDHSDQINVLLVPKHITYDELTSILIASTPNERRICALHNAIPECRNDSSSIVAQMILHNAHTAGYLTGIAGIPPIAPLTNERHRLFGIASLIRTSIYTRSALKDEGVRRDLLELDRYWRLPLNEDTVRKINAKYALHIERTEQLPSAREWLRFHYQGWYEPLYKVALKSGLATELLNSCLELYPNDELKKELEARTESSLNHISTETMVYLLGLPLDNNYQRSDLQVKVERLMNDSEYRREYFENNKKLHKQQLELLQQKYRDEFGIECRVVNEEDIMCESVENYLVSDVVRYVDEKGLIFQITRPEFEIIANKGKNIITNRELPLSLILKLKCEVEIAKRLELPGPLPLLELLGKVTKLTPLLKKLLRPLILAPQDRTNLASRTAPGNISVILGNVDIHSIFRLLEQ
mgnify:CR=1 FL=1